jgi:hypothetical protein
MIFCDEPWCNEPGREGHVGSSQSKEYNKTIRKLTIDYALVPWVKCLEKNDTYQTEASSAPSTPSGNGIWTFLAEKHFATYARQIIRTVSFWGNEGLRSVYSASFTVPLMDSELHASTDDEEDEISSQKPPFHSQPHEIDEWVQKHATQLAKHDDIQSQLQKVKATLSSPSQMASYISGLTQSAPHPVQQQHMNHEYFLNSHKGLMALATASQMQGQAVSASASATPGVNHHTPKHQKVKSKLSHMIGVKQFSKQTPAPVSHPAFSASYSANPPYHHWMAPPYPFQQPIHVGTFSGAGGSLSAPPSMKQTYDQASGTATPTVYMPHHVHKFSAPPYPPPGPPYPVANGVSSTGPPPVTPMPPSMPGPSYAMAGPNTGVGGTWIHPPQMSAPKGVFFPGPPPLPGGPIKSVQTTKKSSKKKYKLDSNTKTLLGLLAALIDDEKDEMRVLALKLSAQDKDEKENGKRRSH